MAETIAGGLEMSSTTDLKQKVFRRLLPSMTGTDLSLSMERENTLWSPSLTLSRGQWRAVWKIERIKIIGLEPHVRSQEK